MYCLIENQYSSCCLQEMAASTAGAILGRAHKKLYNVEVDFPLLTQIAREDAQIEYRFDSLRRSWASSYPFESRDQGMDGAKKRHRGGEGVFFHSVSGMKISESVRGRTNPQGEKGFQKSATSH
jgi:hypothetical protein